MDEDFRAIGTVLVLEGPAGDFPIQVDDFDRWTQHRKTPQQARWQVLSVHPARPGMLEQALVWVADEHRAAFLSLFEEYATVLTETGKPRRADMMANIAAIRSAVLQDLWQSDGKPPAGDHWWELWLRPTDDALDKLLEYADFLGLVVSGRSLALSDRVVTWIRAEWSVLQSLPFTAVPVAEIRRPEFIDSVLDLRGADQQTLLNDLLDRIEPAHDSAPAVCLLDSGVTRGHVLLQGSLAPSDSHTVTRNAADRRHHGTKMAGVALLGDLEERLLSSEFIQLEHRLESVKILPDDGEDLHDPLAFGVVTAAAVSFPEIGNPRTARVFCLAVTADGDSGFGVPTLWSASLDALAAGTAVERDGNNLRLLGRPNPDDSRLFFVSTGNVRPPPTGEGYLEVCDAAPAQDPAQSWNALTVGAFTSKTLIPNDPSFEGWWPVAAPGELSPHSRTGVGFEKRWPIRPDICMEGGNVITDGADGLREHHPAFDLITTDARGDERLTTISATSAATGQAARLGALTMARYPNAWPETVRALIVHGAEWTPAMRAAIAAVQPSKTKVAGVLKRYGWGVPTEQSVLTSSTQSVTMVIEDEFRPFEGKDHRVRAFRMHELPWPSQALEDLGAAHVTLRVTLSYFIEPTAGRRGWARRFSYRSHGLRFDLKRPTETATDFVNRINRAAEDEEAGISRAQSDTDRWLLGERQRNLGSLHQDVWEGGTGPELARCGMLAVHPVGGWWKNNRRSDRQDLPVRYALIVSLKTPEQEIDLYTPIATALNVPVLGA